MSTPLNYPMTARIVVLEYVKAHLDKSDPPRHPTFAIDEVYVVWFVKALQNWKALLSTSLPDNKYYELTYNGDKDALYVDVYVKTDNMAIENFSQIAKRLHEAVVV